MGRARRCLGEGLYETVFMLRTNLFIIIGLGVFVWVYMPLAAYNIISSESLAVLPVEVRLQIALPIISVNSMLLALLVGIIVASSIEQEKTSQILEYLLAYSSHSVGEFLLIKLVSGILLGLIIAVPYTIATYIVVSMHASVSVVFFLWLLATIMFSTVSFTLLMLLVVLMLEQRYAGIIKFAAMLIVFLALTSILRTVHSEQGVLDLSTIISRMTVPLYLIPSGILVFSILVYYLYHDRIIELSLR